MPEWVAVAPSRWLKYHYFADQVFTECGLMIRQDWLQMGEAAAIIDYELCKKCENMRNHAHL
jgi:hypothetical protein